MVDIVAQEPAIRLGVFAGTLAVVGAWELVAPRRRPRVGRLVRWPGNLGLVALNTGLVRVVLPVTAVELAVLADGRGWGLFHVLGPMPRWLAVVLAVVLLDLAIYLQHVALHAVPVLWRLHRVHHADLEFDVTTGIRFHPVEILLSMGYKFLVIAALGPPAAGVLCFEVVLNASSMWSHGNLRLPDTVDRVLRGVVVTPDMHRVHHSVVAPETHSNFGFNLSWWDRLGGTYRAQPVEGHEGMTIGIPLFRDPRWLRLDRLLAQPFVAPTERLRGSGGLPG